MNTRTRGLGRGPAMRRVVAWMVAVCLASCVERALPIGDEIDCAMVRFDPQAATNECATADRCDIVGSLPDGRAVEELCTPDACTLFIHGAQACTCPASRLDVVNTCGNGFPTCRGWVFNNNDIQFCPP